MQGWRRKLLSSVGKEVLLKTIVQAIPLYVMSVFLIPLNFCAELEKMMNSFCGVRMEWIIEGYIGCPGINYVFINQQVEWVFENCMNSI